MGYFGIALCCGIASAMIASSKGRNAAGWFFLGLILGPFGLVFALIVGKEGPSNEERRCPYCAEFIKKGAIVCKHCGRDMPEDDSPQEWEIIPPWHKDEKPSIKICPQCKSRCEIYKIQCPSCGWKPNIKHDMGEWIILDPFQFKGEVAQLKACPKCGGLHQMDATKCGGCGWEPKNP